MLRYTRPKDNYPCRAYDCRMEEFLEDVAESYIHDYCDYCPFEAVFNRLGDFEDRLDLLEDDRK